MRQSIVNTSVWLGTKTPTFHIPVSLLYVPTDAEDEIYANPLGRISVTTALGSVKYGFKFVTVIVKVTSKSSCFVVSLIISRSEQGITSTSTGAEIPDSPQSLITCTA